MSTDKVGAHTTYKAGDIVVVHNLPFNGKNSKSGRMPSKVARISAVLPGGRLRIHLHLGDAFRRSTHYAKIGRTIEIADVLRLASTREMILGSNVLLETLARSVAA